METAAPGQMGELPLMPNGPIEEWEMPYVHLEEMPGTKIVATIGPNTESLPMIMALMIEGVNVFRLNFSHGSHDWHEERIKLIRQASEMLGTPVGIMQDLQGPKVRLGKLPEEGVQVPDDAELVLAYGDSHIPGMNIPMQVDLSEYMEPEQPIFIHDGKIRGNVTGKDKGLVFVKLSKGGLLLSNKGLNVPRTDFRGDVIPEKDKRDMRFGAGTGEIDFIAQSFLQTVDDAVNFVGLMAENDMDALYTAKAETESITDPDNMQELVKYVSTIRGGVMVARGDMGVEIGEKRVAIKQREITELCREYGVFVIDATQNVSTMEHSPMYSRAEGQCIATQTWDRVDAIMTSEETGSNACEYPIKTIRELRAAIREAEQYDRNKNNFRIPFERTGGRDEDEEGLAEALALRAMGRQAVAVLTETGRTRDLLSSLRMLPRIISISSNKRTVQQGSIRYGAIDVYRPAGEGVVHTYIEQQRQLGRIGIKRIPAVSGNITGRQGTSNILQLI